MRFKRRKKILPGVYLNFSGSGISTTIGVPGASVNFGRNGTYLNTGIPGTGLYNRQRIDNPNNSRNTNSYNPSPTKNNIQTSPFSSGNSDRLTSNSLLDLKNTFIECYSERRELISEINKTKRDLILYQLLYFLSVILIIGLIIKKFKRNIIETKSYKDDLINQHENCVINIDLNIDHTLESKFNTLTNKYQDLCSCSKIWDLISHTTQDQRVTRSSATGTIERKQINLDTNSINIINSRFNPLKFANANGGDMYIYPAFLFYFQNENNFALIDIRTLEISLVNQQFMEEESIPSDSTIVKYVWAKSNADGSQDKRFKNNYQIPVCQYGRIDLNTTSGLNESYMFSDYNKTHFFANALYSFIQQAKI
jgi:hypothetical protein